MKHESENNGIWTIDRDGKPDLEFIGILISSVSSRSNESNGRWQDLYLYRTQAGAYVCAVHTVSCWQGERDSYDAGICATLDDVIEYLGQGWLAKEIYADATISNVEVVQ